MCKTSWSINLIYFVSIFDPTRQRERSFRPFCFTHNIMSATRTQPAESSVSGWNSYSGTFYGSDWRTSFLEPGIQQLGPIVPSYKWVLRTTVSWSKVSEWEVGLTSYNDWDLSQFPVVYKRCSHAVSGAGQLTLWLPFVGPLE
jgi:hypothetical protein